MQEIKEELDAALCVKDEIGEKIVLVLEDKGLCEIYFDLRVVPEEWHFQLWEIFNEVMDIDTIQDQRCYSQQTFLEAMIDPEYHKIVLLVDQIPKGMILGTNNLEKARAAYINPEFIRRRYPTEAASGKVFYLTVIYIAREMQHCGMMAYLSLVAVKSIYPNYDVMVSDACLENLYLRDVTSYLLKQVGAHIAKEEILGKQTYYSFVKDKTS